MAVNLVPDKLNLTAGAGAGNTFQILQNTADANVSITAGTNAYVDFVPELKCSSTAGIVASAGDVQSYDAVGAKTYSLNTVAQVQTTQSGQIANIISVLNTAFGLSLS